MLFSLYVLAVATRAVPQDAQDFHTESMNHITALMTVAALMFTVSAILPARPPPITVWADSLSSLTMTWLWSAITVLDIVVCILAFTTPSGPALHYPPEAIYSEKTVTATTNTDQKNVSGVTGIPLFAGAIQMLIAAKQALQYGTVCSFHTRQKSSCLAM